MFSSVQTPLQEARQKIIAEKAYYYWEQHGRPMGSPEVDWLRAEREVDCEAPWSSDGESAQPELPANNAKGRGSNKTEPSAANGPATKPVRSRRRLE
jgi:hypothetical protein